MKRAGTSLPELLLGLSLAVLVFGLLLALFTRTASATARREGRLDVVRASLMARRRAAGEKQVSAASADQPLVRRLYRAVSEGPAQRVPAISRP